MHKLLVRLSRVPLLLAAMLAGAQTDPGPWRFVDPGAKAVISVDWKRVSRSPLGAMLRERWINPGAALPGIQFLDDVDRFLVSSPGGDAGDENAEAPLLVVAIGRFDLANIRRFLLAHRTRPQQFNAFQVYRPQGKNAKDLAFVLFDAQTILIGDSHSIFGGLERSVFERAAPQPGSMLARVAEMDANYDAWALVSDASALGSNRFTDLLASAGMDAETRGFEAGVSLRSGLAADITVTLSSDDAAKNMATEVSRIVRLAAKDKSGEPFLQDLERRLKFASEGSRVRISLRLTNPELEKNAQLFAASRRRAPAPAPEMQPVAKTAPASPPEKQVIRIEGLDGGTREIPFQQP